MRFRVHIRFAVFGLLAGLCRPCAAGEGLVEKLSTWILGEGQTQAIVTTFDLDDETTHRLVPSFWEGDGMVHVMKRTGGLKAHSFQVGTIVWILNRDSETNAPSLHASAFSMRIEQEWPRSLFGAARVNIQRESGQWVEGQIVKLRLKGSAVEKRRKTVALLNRKESEAWVDVGDWEDPFWVSLEKIRPKGACHRVLLWLGYAFDNA